MATWRHFARKTFLRVVLELGLPAATARRDLASCPKHNEPIGPVTGLCESSFEAAWDEVALRYASAEQGAAKPSTERRTA